MMLLGKLHAGLTQAKQSVPAERHNLKGRCTSTNIMIILSSLKTLTCISASVTFIWESIVKMRKGQYPQGKLLDVSEED